MAETMIKAYNLNGKLVKVKLWTVRHKHLSHRTEQAYVNLTLQQYMQTAHTTTFPVSQIRMQADSTRSADYAVSPSWISFSRLALFPIILQRPSFLFPCMLDSCRL